MGPRPPSAEPFGRPPPRLQLRAATHDARPERERLDRAARSRPSLTPPSAKRAESLHPAGPCAAHQHHQPTPPPPARIASMRRASLPPRWRPPGCSPERPPPWGTATPPLLIAEPDKSFCKIRPLGLTPALSLHANRRRILRGVTQDPHEGEERPRLLGHLERPRHARTKRRRTPRGVVAKRRHTETGAPSAPRPPRPAPPRANIRRTPRVMSIHPLRSRRSPRVA